MQGAIQFGDYTITCDPAAIDAGVVRELLGTTYWADKRPEAVIAKSLDNSLTYGAFFDGKQIAMARVVTDYATFGWICDVVVHKAHRGKGLSKAMMEAILSHPDLCKMRRFILATRDAKSLYERYGFKDLHGDMRWMELYQGYIGY